MHACVCVCVCMHACVCVCVAKSVAVELRCHATALIIFCFTDPPDPIFWKLERDFFQFYFFISLRLMQVSYVFSFLLLPG